MNSDDIRSSGSDQSENTVQIRSTVLSSVHSITFKRSTKPSTAEGAYADDSRSTFKQREAMDSHRDRSTRTKHMETLPDVDEELDYNEDDLPSLTRREITPTDARHKSRGIVISPREEGEEYSEEEDESYPQPEVRRGRSDKFRSHPDREEGEASSEEDRRYHRYRQQQKQSSSKHVSSSTSAATASNVDLLLDEAHYRHRLQERYERREAKRSKNASTNIHEEERNLSLTRSAKSSSSQTQFLVPRSKIDSSPNANLDAMNPTGPAPSERDRRWHSSSSDKTRRHMPDDVSGFADERLPEERKSSRKHGKSEKKFSDHASSRSKRPDRDISPPDSKSYSTSLLNYEQAPTEGEQRFRADLQHSEMEVSKKMKSKKSKRERADREERREHKKSAKVPKPQSYPQLDYGNWDGSKLYDELYDNPPSDSTKALPTRSTDRFDYGSDNTGSSSRSSSYSASAHRETQDSSSSRKHRSRHGALTGSNSDAVYTKTKHKRHYHRDTRESAPPPDTSRTQGLPEPEVRKAHSRRDHKLDKNKLSGGRLGDEQPPPKRNRKSQEVELDAVHASRSHSRSRDRSAESDLQGRWAPGATRITSALIPSSDQISETDTSKQVPTRPMRTEIAGYPHSPSSSNSSRSGSPDNISRDKFGEEQPKDDPEQDDVIANRDRSQSLSKRTLAPSTMRPGPYRLYSESESEVEDYYGDMASNAKANGDARHDMNGIAQDRIGASTEPQKSPIPSKPFYFPSIQGCRSVEEFECLNRIEEGTYGVVYRARDKKTNEIVALKRLKMEKERDGFPITSLREINTLMKAQHENIVTVREIVVGSNMDKIYLVMDYVEHDLKSLMEIMNGPFSVGEVKCLLVQLLRAVRHLHDNWILHRDLKTSNLLLSHQGILKVGDFGLAREYGSPLKHYTEVVVTLWYRAPELLLGIKQYTCPIDLWSVGCIFAEFLLQRPLFPGKGEVDELNIIFRDLGTPTERIWPGVSQLPGMKKCVFTDYPYNQLRRRFTEKQISDQGFDLLNSFLTYCPEKRITADKALNHAYFNERPRAIHPSMFPSWPAKSEGAITATRKASPRPPAGGGALAAAAAALASVGNSGPGSRVRYQPPAPPMGGQRFYSSMGIGGGADSRPGTAIGSGDLLSSGPDKGFLLRF